MSGKGSAARVKDVLTEHISRDIKELQRYYSDMSEVVDMINSSNTHAQALCEHLDHVLLHGIRECDHGYWPFVSYFTRRGAVQEINNLSNITTDLGRGRAWLYIALNEQAMESYIRMFIENQQVAQEFYLGESFIRDCERLSVVLTLISGLDFINFELNPDSDYLDHSPTAPSSHMGIFRTSEFTPDIEPRFISVITPEVKLRMEREKQLHDQPIAAPAPPSEEKEKSSFSLTGMLDSVFKSNTSQKVATPTDHTHLPPPPIIAGPSPSETSAVNTNAQTPPTERSSSFSLSGILGSVFKGGDATQRQATPTDPAYPPAPIAAGPTAQEVKSSSLPGAAAASNGLSTSPPPPARQTSMDEDTNLRRSSSDEPSQFHRTMVQDPTPIPEDVFHSHSPISVPMLTNQSIKSDVVRKAEEDEDVVVVGEKSSRSKKSKGKKKKKKKKTGSYGLASMTTTEAFESLAASLSAGGSLEEERREERDVDRREEREEVRKEEREEERREPEPSAAALDDFVDTFGKGGVEAAQPMPAVPEAEVREERKAEEPPPPLHLKDEEKSAVVDDVASREVMVDRKSSERFLSSFDRGERGRKGDDLATDKRLHAHTADVAESEEVPVLEERGGESLASDNDKDSLLSPDFVKRDLLSEALEELNGMGGAGEGRGVRDDARLRERTPPSRDQMDSGSNLHDSLSLKTKDVFEESSKMDDFPSPSGEEERTIGGASLSENVHDVIVREGNPPLERRTSEDIDNLAGKSPLQSSSDSAIGATKAKAASFSGSWTAGQYVSKVSTKIGFRFNRSNSRGKNTRGKQRKRSVDDVVDEFDVIEMPKPLPTPEAPPCAEPRKYSSPPKRSNEITARDKQAADIAMDDNMRLIFSLEIYTAEDEEAIRLIQAATPTGLGQLSIVFVLITNKAVYILRKDGTEGMFSKQLGILYSSFEHIVLGLGGQSLILVYHPPSTSDTSGSASRDRPPQKFVLITGNNAVSRSVFASIREAAMSGSASNKEYRRAVPLNKDDESRINAIEKELIVKLGTNTSFEIVHYCLVHWEQLSGEAPMMSQDTFSQTGKMSGNLLVKTTNVLGITSWKPGFFKLVNGSLYHFASDSDRVAKNIYQLEKCGGCARSSGENKSFAFTLHGEENLILAAANEEELTQWIQALCLAAVESKTVDSPTHSRRSHSFCAILLTKNKIHVLHEDWSDESVQLVTCCEVTDVTKVSIDSTLPFYCTVSYETSELQGEWLVCFNSEQELGKFESYLASTWLEEFQIDLDFVEVTDGSIRQRAHRAVELMHGSKHRSDSITRGRTELTYSLNI